MLLSGGRQRIRRVFQEIERSYGVIDTLSPTTQSVASTFTANSTHHAVPPTPPDITASAVSSIDSSSGARSSSTSNCSFEKFFAGLRSSSSSSSISSSSSSPNIASFDLPHGSSDGKLQSAKRSRKVSFHPIAQVVLIPTRHEYHEALLGQFIWWTRKELKYFQQEARYEMRQLKRYAMYMQRFAAPASTFSNHMGSSLLSLVQPTTDSAQSTEPNSPSDSISEELETLTLAAT